MKGLLIKDLYMTWKYCKPYTFIVILFTVLSGFTDNMFLYIYPLVFVSMIPFTLGAYDERARWNMYCDTLPVSRKTVVSSRYFLAAMYTFATVILSFVSYIISSVVTSNLNLRAYFSILAMMMLVALINSSVILPIYFKYGTEKARIIYMVAVGATAAVTMGVSVGLGGELPKVNAVLIILIGIAVYALSWLTSMHIYQKREL